MYVITQYSKTDCTVKHIVFYGTDRFRFCTTTTANMICYFFLSNVTSYCYSWNQQHCLSHKHQHFAIAKSASHEIIAYVTAHAFACRPFRGRDDCRTCFDDVHSRLGEKSCNCAFTPPCGPRAADVISCEWDRREREHTHTHARRKTPQAIVDTAAAVRSRIAVGMKVRARCRRINHHFCHITHTQTGCVRHLIQLIWRPNTSTYKPNTSEMGEMRRAVDIVMIPAANHSLKCILRNLWIGCILIGPVFHADGVEAELNNDIIIIKPFGKWHMAFFGKKHSGPSEYPVSNLIRFNDEDISIWVRSCMFGWLLMDFNAYSRVLTKGGPCTLSVHDCVVSTRSTRSAWQSGVRPTPPHVNRTH